METPYRFGRKIYKFHTGTNKLVIVPRIAHRHALNRFGSLLLLANRIVDTFDSGTTTLFLFKATGSAPYWHGSLYDYGIRIGDLEE